jgi:hypothetical protein
MAHSNLDSLLFVLLSMFIIILGQIIQAGEQEAEQQIYTSSILCLLTDLYTTISEGCCSSSNRNACT